MTTLAKTVAIIGAGPAGLMAAEVIAAAGLRVTIFEQMPSAGRKLLMAGRGGLNLTHSEARDAFHGRYGAAEPQLRAALDAFTPQMLRDWSAALGQQTFVGSSGRVFPSAMKASPLLRAWLRRLDSAGVQLRLRHRWRGWRDGALAFDTPEGEMTIAADAVVLALGGASWPSLGATGSWREILMAQDIDVAPFLPANCGFSVAWSELFRDRFAGQPLKGIALTFQGRSLRGEAMITSNGIEGGAIYALSAHLRDAVLRDGVATLQVALRPDSTDVALAEKLSRPRGKQSMTTFLRKALNLSPAAIGLLQEASLATTMPLATLTPLRLAQFINAVPLTLSGVAPLSRAISSAGGIRFAALDADLMLRQRPGVFACGEMLDWEAPTGGYLLQACFATGAAAGTGVVRWLQGTA